MNFVIAMGSDAGDQTFQKERESRLREITTHATSRSNSGITYISERYPHGVKSKMYRSTIGFAYRDLRPDLLPDTVIRIPAPPQPERRSADLSFRGEQPLDLPALGLDSLE